MAGVLDFLFGGTTPPSTTTSGSTITDLPPWLSDYSKSIISQGGALAGMPYQPYEGPRLAGLTPDQLQAAGLVRSNTGQAPGIIQGALNQPGALAAAQPYLTQASRTFPSAVNEYMSPYIENVINRAGTLAGRQFNEKILPGISATFGAAGSGQGRSTEMRRLVDQNARDLAEGLQEQSLAALDTGYGRAADIFGQDQTRLGTLGQYAGYMAGQERGQTADLGTALQKAQQGDVTALQDIGAQEQGTTQKSYDLAYQDFLNQLNYPKEQLGWLSGLVNQYPGKATTSTETGPATSVGPSPIAQAGSIATGITGLLKLLKGQNEPTQGPSTVARGGRIRKRPVGALRMAYA